MICSVDDLRSSLRLMNPETDEDRNRYIKGLTEELDDEYRNRIPLYNYQNARRQNLPTQKAEILMDKPRQIKFRGLSMAGEGWVYGYYRYVAFGSYENHKIYDPASRIETDVIPETVGQWTGLTDKNGTEIYDGDMLKIKDHVSGTFIVKWDDYRVAWWGKNIKERDREFFDDFFQLLGCSFQKQRREVVGNIHVNKRKGKSK